jgi:lysozyme
VITKPKLTDHRSWTFWQYTNREKLSGYHGKEKYIDMNVFNGNVQVFHEYIAALGYRDKD